MRWELPLPQNGLSGKIFQKTAQNVVRMAGLEPAQDLNRLVENARFTE
jgi:hypothetical protein